MIQFLIHKPVSVLMTFLAILLLSVFSIRKISVTLLPDIDIPTISVLATYPDHSAVEMEQTVMSVLRQNIQQVGGVRELQSKAADEQGRLTIHFPYGRDIDLAFIEVNEKLDVALNALPDDLARPVVVKTNASDIPAVYLTVRYKDSIRTGSRLDINDFVTKTVRRRLEQLPTVSMADITGTLSGHFVLTPHTNRLQSLGITHRQIQEAIQRANITLGNIMVRERQYEYRIRVGQPLHSLDELRNIPLKIGDQVFLLRELADVSLATAEPQGLFMDHDRPAFNLALFKDYASRMNDFETEVKTTLEDLRASHPDVLFYLNRDQSRLLDMSISGMESALWLGCLLATITVFFFYRDRRIPIIVGLVTPLSLAVSILFLYLAGLSMNIVSLSGIILGIGMMIDNGIIILDNIVQESMEGYTTEEACIRGTNQMAMPLLSSMLTTCAVFLPLIFLSDLAGALFYDQAVSVAICLGVSYLVSIVFIPTVYFRIFRKKPVRAASYDSGSNAIRRAYDWGFHFTFDRGAWIVVVVLVVGAMGWVAYGQLEKETMPALPRQAFLTHIQWNEPLTIERMAEQIGDLYRHLEQDIEDFQSYLGPQQFVLNDHYRLDGESTSLYLSVDQPDQRTTVREKVQAWFQQHFPRASVEFSPDKDLFEVIFSSEQQPDYVAFYHHRLTGEEALAAHRALKTEWKDQYGIEIHNDPATTEVTVLSSRDLEMLRYNVDKNYALEVITQNLQQITLAEIRQLDGNIPVVLTTGEKGIDHLFAGLQILNRDNQALPLDYFFNTSTRQRLKYIFADQRGSYIPEQIRKEDLSAVPAAIQSRKLSHPTENFKLVSPELQSRELVREMGLALLVSLALLYLIVAAQFESLLTPLIILMEIPIAVAGALILLWLTGHTLNAMAMIGMVVTVGIVINDSIIKIDTISRIYQRGLPLRRAIHEGGQKRLYPILMTSVTTILALVPYLWQQGFGVAMQQPLAIALIGSMFIGTLVSLFFIPKMYYWMIK